MKEFHFHLLLRTGVGVKKKGAVPLTENHPPVNSRALFCAAIVAVVIDDLDFDAIRPVCDFGNTSFDLYTYRMVEFFNTVA